MRNCTCSTFMKAITVFFCSVPEKYFMTKMAFEKMGFTTQHGNKMKIYGPYLLLKNKMWNKN